jgi:hypothetical protein
MPPKIMLVLKIKTRNETLNVKGCNIDRIKRWLENEILRIFVIFIKIIYNDTISHLKKKLN